MLFVLWFMHERVLRTDQTVQRVETKLDPVISGFTTVQSMEEAAKAITAIVSSLGSDESANIDFFGHNLTRAKDYVATIVCAPTRAADRSSLEINDSLTPPGYRRVTAVVRPLKIMLEDANPYRSTGTSFRASQTGTKTSSVSAGGIRQALCLWGAVSVLSATLPVFIQTWPKLPNQQSLISYAILIGIAIFGSVITWVWFILADLSSQKSKYVLIGMYLIAFTIASLPGINVFYRHADGVSRIPGNAGLAWYTFRFTILFLLPIVAYAIGRTKRWTEDPVERA